MDLGGGVELGGAGDCGDFAGCEGDGGEKPGVGLATRCLPQLMILSERPVMGFNRTFKRSGQGLAIFAVGFIAVLIGVGLFIWHGNAREHPPLRLLGAGLLLGSICCSRVLPIGGPDTFAPHVPSLLSRRV